MLDGLNRHLINAEVANKLKRVKPSIVAAGAT